jgi:copper resistance protein B
VRRRRKIQAALLLLCAWRAGAAGHVPPAPPQQALAAMSNQDMIQMMGMDDRALFGKVLVEQFEWRTGSSAAWQAQAWYGGDYDKLWLKTEGQRNHGASREARAELLWDRIIAPWWNLQAGVRRDFGEGPARSWLAFGVAGLAPGRFDVEATLYAGDAGRSAARFKVEYNLLLTQRCVMQPEIESNLYGKEDPDRRLGSGLANVDIAVRLRYELRREFAPYVGVVWSRYFAGSAGFARADGLRADEWRFVSGLRIWF